MLLATHPSPLLWRNAARHVLVHWSLVLLMVYSTRLERQLHVCLHHCLIMPGAVKFKACCCTGVHVRNVHLDVIIYVTR